MRAYARKQSVVQRVQKHFVIVSFFFDLRSLAISWDLRNVGFTVPFTFSIVFLDFYIPFALGLLYPYSTWTIIYLFYLEFCISFPFGLLYAFFLILFPFLSSLLVYFIFLSILFHLIFFFWYCFVPFLLIWVKLWICSKRIMLCQLSSKWNVRSCIVRIFYCDLRNILTPYSGEATTKRRRLQPRCWCYSLRHKIHISVCL